MEQNKKINIINPTECHIWKMESFDDSSVDTSIVHSFESIKEYLDDSHDIRRLLRCKQCHQPYYYSFYEWIDWVGGNDPQYRTWIPVAAEEDADALALLSPFELLQYFPRLQSDWPADAERPKTWWNRESITK